MAAKVKFIPEGYHAVTPYLTVIGAAKLIDFLKQVFDAVEIERMSKADGVVQHAEVRMGDSILMMGEAPDAAGSKPGQLYLYVEDVDATYRRALQAGAVSLREPQDMFYGDRVSGVQDAFGNSLWIATHIEDVTPAEVARRAANLK